MYVCTDELNNWTKMVLRQKAKDLVAFVSWFWLYLPNLKHGRMITLNSFILPVCFDFCLRIICLFSRFEPGEIMALRPEQLTSL